MTQKEVQYAAYECIIASDFRGRCRLPPGTGKSKLIIDCIKAYETKYDPTKVLLGVSNKALRDVNWPQEFAKWGKPTSVIDIICYQSSYKFNEAKLNEYGLIVMDEFDVALTNKYCKNIIEYWMPLNRPLIGLSATEEDFKKEYSKFLYPLLYETSIWEALGTYLNDINIIGIPHRLNTNNKKIISIRMPNYRVKTVEVSDEEEALYYASLLDPVDKLWKEVAKINKIIAGNLSVVSELVLPVNSEHNWYEHKRSLIAKAIEVQKKDEVFYRTVGGNLDKLSYSNEVTLHTTSALANKIKTLGSKVLVFGRSKEELIDYFPHTYTGNDSNDILKRFMSGEIKSLGVCKKMDRGISINGLQYGITIGFTKSETDFVQRDLGRLTRLGAGNTAFLYVMLPYAVKPDGTRYYLSQYRNLFKIVPEQYHHKISLHE